MSKPTPTQLTCILAIIVMVVVALWKNEHQDTLQTRWYRSVPIDSVAWFTDHSEIRKGE